MPRLENRLPAYRGPKPSGQASVLRSGQDFLLGRHGTDASRRHCDRVVAERLEGGRHPLEAMPVLRFR